MAILALKTIAAVFYEANEKEASELSCKAPGHVVHCRIRLSTVSLVPTYIHLDGQRHVQCRVKETTRQPRPGLGPLTVGSEDQHTNHYNHYITTP